MMMLTASNSLVRLKNEAQGKEEEWAAGRREEGQTGTQMAGADAPTGQTRSAVSDSRNKRKHGRWCGVLFHMRVTGGQGLVLSSHDRKGVSYIRMNEVVKV